MDSSIKRHLLAGEYVKCGLGAGWVGFECLQQSWSVWMGFGTVEFNYYYRHGLGSPS